MLLIDFETRSHADLRRVGAYRYALHPTTDIICVCFKLGEHEYTWRNPTLYGVDYTTDTARHAFVSGDDAVLCRYCGEHSNWHPPQIPEVNHALESDGLVAAHNAGFDRLIWEHVAVPRYNFPMIPLERWYCTSAMCRVNGLPASLDDAARATGGNMRKDFRGAELIRKCSIPPYSESREDLDAMVEYCQQDLRVQASLVNACRPMSDVEHQDWIVNERINDRGVRVDRPLADLATYYAEDEVEAIRAALHHETDGAITSHSQHQRIKKWLFANTPAAAHALMYRYKDGVKKATTDKAVRQELLGRADELDLSDKARYVIELVSDGNRSSVAKFERMLEMSTEENPRVYGAFMYAGAASTLRFTSRGLQLHNMRRDAHSPERTEELRHMMQQDEDLPDVMDTLSQLLRPALIPADGNVFVVGDWSAIEARALPWLAEYEPKLDLFREGKDIYVETAAQLGPEFDRQMGKVAELSLGYGGGVGAFNAMGRNYGVFLPAHRAKAVVDRWRAANHWCVDFWHRLKAAAHYAVRNPGVNSAAGKHVCYTYYPRLLGGSLLCRLPGNIVLTYPQVRFEEDDYDEPVLTALKASWTPKADAKEWPRVRLWHGVLAENVTQSLCAGILRWALGQLDNVFIDVATHTHDEVVAETPESEAEEVQGVVDEVMNASPPFAWDLPLSAEPVIMTRYGKP